MEVQQDDHLVVAGLEEGVFDVVVEHINFVAAQRGVTETVDMGFQRAADPLSNDVRPHVKILKRFQFFGFFNTKGRIFINIEQK